MFGTSSFAVDSDADPSLAQKEGGAIAPKAPGVSSADTGNPDHCLCNTNQSPRDVNLKSGVAQRAVAPTNAPTAGADSSPHP